MTHFWYQWRIEPEYSIYPLLYLTVEQSNPTTKRKQVKHACNNCRKNHSACDINRPCKRCKRLKKPCIDPMKQYVSILPKPPSVDIDITLLYSPERIDCIPKRECGPTVTLNSGQLIALSNIETNLWKTYF